MRSILEVFDESGDLRPIHRVVLPRRYADYRAEQRGLSPAPPVTDAESERFREIEKWLRAGRPSFLDPDAPTRFDEPPDALALFIVHSDAHDVVRWSDWCVQIGEHPRPDGLVLPLTEYIAFSFYAPWQRYRCWALLDERTIRALLHPRRLTPHALFERDGSVDLDTEVLFWRTGGGDALRVVSEVEDGGWIAALYRARDVINHSLMRVHSPRAEWWPEGEGLSTEARAEAEDARVVERCRELAAPWADDPHAFAAHLRSLLALYQHALQNFPPNGASAALRNDVEWARRWANFAFRATVGDWNALVGSASEFEPDVTLDAVLRPVWWRARRIAEERLPELVTAFNQTTSLLRLDENDLRKYLEYLDENELHGWYAEFAALVDEIQQHTDLGWTRRFLHLRSLALLNEPILVALADEFGTDADRKHMTKGTTVEPLKAFLADRKGDWRGDLWQHVANHRNCFSDARTKATLVERLEKISSLNVEKRYAGLTRMLLTFALLRNFGSHRFLGDARLLREYQARLNAAAMLTPLFYWKVATSPEYG